ncbi:methyltransferase-like protein 17, mitochondrial, partial [Copidosoma floridanum]|uniref:methyltransferase-like protein 17, mitochondrial n=1 Tax=Copidosoma floridanum TaxID=29053 RepID=UPI000C6F4B74
LKEEVERLVESEKIKPRHHPGVLKRQMITLPDWVIDAMRLNLEDTDKKRLFQESQQLSQYLFNRRLPAETQDVKTKYNEIEGKMLEKVIDTLTPEELEEKRKMIKTKVIKKVKNEIYDWKALQFTKYQGLMYMISRSTAEYSVLVKIFEEIKNRDPEFVPQAIFDFGSGVGTVLWAALNHWPNGIREYVGIDISNQMHDLSENIMKHSPTKVRGVFLRQYMPVTEIEHDIVISAYSLMELPSIRNRLEIIARLWKKTNKYLIFVEQGSQSGFKESIVMNEARSFIKHIMDNFEKSCKYFIFAPCPHETTCPRYAENNYPCNFIVQHGKLPLMGSSSPKQELYTYIVFKKGERTDQDNWHRLVRPTIVRSKHVRCRTCSPNGQLEEILFTPKRHGKWCYRCAKGSKWGDRLPIDTVKDESNENINASEIDENESETDSDTECVDETDYGENDKLDGEGSSQSKNFEEKEFESQTKSSNDSKEVLSNCYS